MPNRQSTADDVKKLTELGCQPGETFSWDALEEILVPLKRTDRRFRTIYRAWIRHLRKWHNRKAIVVPGEGVRILRENQRAEDVCTTLGKTWTLFDRAKTDVDDIQIAELTQPEVEETHFVRHVTHRLHHTMQDERAKLAARPAMPAPSPSLPVRQLAPRVDVETSSTIRAV